MPLPFLEHFKAARRASTPIIVVQTPDPAATMSGIATDPDHARTPMIKWDSVMGLTWVNEPIGKQLAMGLWKEGDSGKPEPTSLGNPIDMLIQAMRMPPKSILFMLNLHRFMGDPQIVQAVWNLRDQFKQQMRTLVIPCPGITLPPELSQDVLILDEPLPNAEELAGIIGETYTAANASGAKIPMPNNEMVTKYVDALCGLSPFAAEQVCSMSIKKDGMDVDQLWERKRQQIEQTPGLTVWRGGEKFAGIGGCENIKTFLHRLMNGKNPPRAIVFQDEIEKAFAGGMGGDLSGVTQELLGYQLSFMQDHKSSGLLFVGHPGAAKSAIAKAAGNEAGIPTIQFDLGAAKGSLVGESNANMRMMLKVVEAVSQGRALWIATSNDISGLPTELRRRYKRGTFFFDLPTPSERKLIWNIYFKQFELTEKERGDLPVDTGWTGSEIENCCDLAWSLEVPLKEAATSIIPLATSAKERIRKLRQDADGRYISAAQPGPYKAPEEIEELNDQPEVVAVAVATKRRKIDTGGSGKVN